MAGRATRQARSEGCGLLGTRGCSRLGQYTRRYHCLSQSGGSEKELGRDDGGPGLSSSD